MSKRQGYDVDKARDYPVDYEDEVPDGYDDGGCDELVELGKHSMTQSEAAMRAGSVLAKMDKNDIDALYKALAPVTHKVSWYRSRYRQMQSKIWYLSDEVERLLKNCNKLRDQVKELGKDPRA